jgi:tetratricopeptide (TPR) repeat protein
MKRVFFGFFTMFFLLIGEVRAFEIDPFDPKASLVENFSTNCLQMTQSQQIFKAYLMVALNSNFQNPKEKLQKALLDYDKRAVEVKEYFQNLLKKEDGAKEAIEAFERAFKLWRDSKKMLETTPTKENALKIKSNLLSMIDELLKGTKPLATPDLELISLTGKLCRKPMEITNDYLLKIWGVKNPNFKSEIDQIIKNFHKNLSTLRENPLNNSETLKLLDKSERGFKFFEFMIHSKSRFIPNLLSKKADDNFKIIREIKKIYKRQASKRAN